MNIDVHGQNRRRPTIESVPRDGNQPRHALPEPLHPPEAERRLRRQRLACAFRLFGRYGYEVGLAGHFTARDPILTDHFWVNPLGMAYGTIRASDLLLVNPAGDVVQGEGMVNLSGVPYHDAIQQARPEAVGIAHAHSFHAKVWSSLARVLDPITADAAFFHDDQVVFNPRRAAGKTYEQDRASVVAQAVAALGKRFIMFENAAAGQLMAEAVGGVVVPPTPGKTADARAKAEIGAWLSFLPLWDKMVREEPDLLD